jgi:hypothetical protein
MEIVSHLTDDDEQESTDIIGRIRSALSQRTRPTRFEMGRRVLVVDDDALRSKAVGQTQFLDRPRRKLGRIIYSASADLDDFPRPQFSKRIVPINQTECLQGSRKPLASALFQAVE